MQADDFIQVITTIDSEAGAAKIADGLVGGRLAACVQVAGPIRSTYRWRGQVEQATEWQCLIKTRRALYAQVERTIRALHPYETPEIIAVPLLAGGADYLGWIAQETAAAPAEP